MARWTTPTTTNTGGSGPATVAAPTGTAATDTATIQNAINAASTAGGGQVVLAVGNYATNATITIPHKVRLVGQGAGASSITYSGSSIAVQHSPTTEAYDTRAGIADLAIIGTSAAGATGLEVSDTYGFGVERVVIRDFTGTGACGFRLHNKLRWTEGTEVTDLHVRNCTLGVGLRTSNTGAGGNSFGWTRFDRVSVNVPVGGTGFYVGDGGNAAVELLLYNSKLYTLVWLLENATGYRFSAAAQVERTEWYMLGEEDGSRTGTVGVNNAGDVLVSGAWAEGLGDTNTFGNFKVMPALKTSDWSQGTDANGHTYHQVATLTPQVQHDAAFGFYEANNISSPYIAMYEGAGNAFKVLRVNWNTKVTAATTALLMLVNKDGDIYAGRTVASARGTTAQRPSAATVGAGAMWYDTTLGIPIWSNGTNWRNASGTAV